MITGGDSLSINIQVGLAIGVTFLWAAKNVLRIDQQGWIYTLAAIIQILSIFLIALSLWTRAPQHATIRDVFTSTYNGTGFPFPYVCVIGILSTLFAFSGYEGNFFMAEHQLRLQMF